MDVEPVDAFVGVSGETKFSLSEFANGSTLLSLFCRVPYVSSNPSAKMILTLNPIEIPTYCPDTQFPAARIIRFL
eukprot:1031471-Amorphochlora_amoeboformis.AAC.1